MSESTLGDPMKFNLPDELIFLKNSRAIQHVSSLSLENKVIVLSGATSGIGLATAHRFAKDKAHLILIVRNKQKGIKLQKELIKQYNAKVKLIIADFQRFETIREASQRILKYTDRIDILINNAGIHSTTLKVSPSGFDQVLTVNYLSPFILTHLLFPALAVAKGRVIFVNSEGHRFASFKPDDLLWKKRRYTGLRSYGASKTAQLLSVQALAKRSKSHGVTVIAMHPGDVKSNIGKNNGWLYRTFSRFFIQPFLKNVDGASNALHYLSAEKSIENNSGKFYHLTIVEKPASFANNAERAEEIYELTCEWTQVNKLEKSE